MSAATTFVQILILGTFHFLDFILSISLENFFQLKICSQVVSRNISLQNSKNVSHSNSKKTERLERQKEIVRGFQNLTEVSKILEYQMNHDIFGLIPTVCQDRFDQFDILHGFEENNFTESDDEFNHFDDIIGIDEIAAIISKGYEDIRASNPKIRSMENQIDKNQFDELIVRVLKRKSYRAFEELMIPFSEFQSSDMQIDALLLAAKFIPFVPKIAANIQYWVTSNLNLSTQQLQNYNENLPPTNCHQQNVSPLSKLALLTKTIADF